jgi:hypothetical protein
VTGRKVRHRLEDPLTDRGLFVVGSGIQLWSTWFMFVLVRWAFDDNWFAALVCVLFYDAIGLITARVGADPRNATKRQGGTRVRGLAWAIATACFAFTFAGNFLSHHIVDDPELQWLKPWVRDVVGAGPVLLLLACLVLRTKMKAYRTRVVADEEKRAIAEAERKSREEAERRERELQRQEREQQRLRDREQEKQETPPVADVSASKLLDQRILEIWARGEEPDCPALDKEFGTKTLARQRRNALRKQGHGPVLEEEKELVPVG